jgi:DNA-binding NtrC family response regulator
METQTQPTILVVEDEAIIRMYAVDLLEDAGYRVLEAQDSDDALVMLAAHPEIELMVTDVDMPGRLDGLGLIGEMNTSYPRILSVVVSGHVRVDAALKAGATRFVAKPYMPSTIVGAVHDTMRDVQHARAA